MIIVTGLTAELALRGPALADGLTPADIPALRHSMLADVVMILADIALAVAFYQLLQPVHATRGLAAMIFRLLQASLIGTSLILLSAVPALIESNPALAATLAQMHASGYDIGLILFGVNSLLMASLLCATRIPRALPPMLAASGLVYITGGLTRLAAPHWTTTLEPAYLLCIVTETALGLWLLTRARL